MMEVEFLEIKLQGNIDTNSGKDGEKIQQLKHKSFSDKKFPILELEDGETFLSEGLSVFKWVSRNKYAGFYDSPLVDQWIDILSQRVLPLLDSLIAKIMGLQASEVKAFSQEVIRFKQSLAFIDKHLLLRNFLVGHQMTLADVFLTVLMIEPYQLIFDKKTRDHQLPNLTRFMSLNLQTLHFKRTFGRILFCTKDIKPNFDIQPEAPKKDAPAKDAKDNKKGKEKGKEKEKG
jgi:elongation factor 1-gamma